MNDNDSIFLKVTGGWISPQSIRTVQVYEGDSTLLKLFVLGYDSPILLNRADSAYIREYLESRTWQVAKVEAQE